MDNLSKKNSGGTDGSRSWFALVQGWRWRKALKRSLSSEHSLKQLTHLTPVMLKTRHVRCLVLDFDGVMASHGETVMHSDVSAWLTAFSQDWSLSDVVILSNKPIPTRIQALKATFPEIDFIQGVAPKPYPQGLQEIAQQRNLLPADLLLVDDRLGTGMLAVILAGSQGMLVLNPYQNYLKRPFKELFFGMLRKVERFLIKWSS